MPSNAEIHIIYEINGSKHSAKSVSLHFD